MPCHVVISYRESDTGPVMDGFAIKLRADLVRKGVDVYLDTVVGGCRVPSSCGRVVS